MNLLINSPFGVWILFSGPVFWILDFWRIGLFGILKRIGLEDFLSVLVWVSDAVFILMAVLVQTIFYAPSTESLRDCVVGTNFFRPPSCLLGLYHHLGYTHLPVV